MVELFTQPMGPFQGMGVAHCSYSERERDTASWVVGRDGGVPRTQDQAAVSTEPSRQYGWSVIAPRPYDLISPAYLQEQKILHAAPRGYGGRGEKWAGVVLQVALKYEASSILDYGCGAGSLARVLRSQDLGVIRVDEYDPAIPGKDAPPSFADLVNVTDVLEHIEPDRLQTVLAHIRGLARKCVFAVISTKSTNKVLSDGRNAHLIIKPGAWWKDQLRAAGFELHPPPSIVRQKDTEWVGVLTP